MFEANNFHDIYIYGLKEHSNNYECINIPRDCRQKEKIFYTFKLTNPIERVCYEKARKANLVFQYAEFLWYLSGSDQLDFISYYAKGIKKFSKDGVRLTGTAYGTKLRGSYFQNHMDQIETVIELLKAEPDTKRAVISIFQPQELLDFDSNIDVSCTLSIQYMIRDKKLISIVNMRANDMFLGIISDVFSFTMLQEYIANRLGIEVGEYYHVVGSSHIYEQNWGITEKIIQCNKKYADYQMKFPKMVSNNLEQDIEAVLYHEKMLRENKEKLTADLIDKFSISNYWKQVIMLFELQREKSYEGKLNQRNKEYLYPVFFYFADMKFQ